MASVTENNGVRIIDPNPEGTNISHEDLTIYVNLKARTKSRSIIENVEEKVVEVQQIVSNVKGETTYTHPSGAKYLTTDWTEIGGGKLNGGEDVGSFGIAGINIDIKSSFVPLVVVDFIDVRGAALFEQGPCSPYASFFHMPYPVFELTVKGFYGNAVTYTLALRKFNTKFNSSTGNFEIKAEFIGYTYAFLADIVMGYALTAPYMPGADEKLNDIWEKTLKKLYPLDIPSENRMQETPVTIRKMLADINGLEKILGELGNTTEFRQVSKLNSLKLQAQELNSILKRFKSKSEELSNTEYVKSEYEEGGFSKLKIPLTKSVSGGTLPPTKAKDLVKEYFGYGNPDDLGQYEVSLKTLNGNNEIKVVGKLGKVEETIKEAGLYKETKYTTVESGSTSESFYYLDIGESFSKPVDTFLIDIDVIIDLKQTELTEIINETVTDVLGYTPTIKNIMMIILSNVELFLTLMVDASMKAEDIHEGEEMPQFDSGDSGLHGDGHTNHVYPWPLYYSKDIKKGNNSVETFPGKNADLLGWEEVKFVENFISAYLEMKLDLELITGDFSGRPGFDNYVPMNPIESPLFGGKTPNSYFRDELPETIYKNIGERCFMVGDYTLMNGLTAWKSRNRLVDTVGGNAVGVPITFDTLLSKFSVREDSTNSSKWSKLTSEKLMKEYGILDGINCVNTLSSDSANNIMLQATTKPEIFKKSVIKHLTEKNGTFKSEEFGDWAANDVTGVSAANIENQLKKINSWTSYYENIGGEQIYTYGELTMGDPRTKSIGISPNPHETVNNFIILPEQGAETTITLKDPSNLTVGSSINGTNSPYYEKLGASDKKIFSQDGNSISEGNVFTLSDKTYIPTVTTEWNKSFVHLKEFDDNSGGINLDIGQIMTYDKTTYSKSIQTGDGTKTASNNIVGVDFGGPWSPDKSEAYNGGGGTHDALIQTPLWAKNLDTSRVYKTVYGNTYFTTDQRGLHAETQDSHKALAYLTLISLGDSGTDVNKTGFAGWYDGANSGGKDQVSRSSISPLFKVTGSEVKVPKAFTLITGAVLWRMKESGLLEDIDPTISAKDPIEWWDIDGTTTNTTLKSDVVADGDDTGWWILGGNGIKVGDTLMTGGTQNTFTNTPSLSKYIKLEPHHWPHATKPNTVPWGKGRFVLIQNNSEMRYVDIRTHMKTLLMLPVKTKEQFINKFTTWCETTSQWPKYLQSLDPLSSGVAIETAFDYYSVGRSYANISTFGVKNGKGDGDNGKTPNEDIVEMYNYLYQTHDTYAFATPKAFYGINEEDFSNTFNIRKKEFDSFIDGWIIGFKKATEKKSIDKQNGEDGATNSKSASEDDDIKLNLYRSFKSIYDKWISTSDSSGGDLKLFYNNVSNNEETTKLLIEHFGFVDRAFTDIGNKAVIDITQLKTLANNPTTSLYQTISELLSKNNFDFFPLPGFIDFGKASEPQIKEMFEPITNLENISSAPSFICMFIGGTSKSLSMGPLAQASCGGDGEILYRYEDDGTTIKEDSTLPADIAAGGQNVTAFLVEYGVDNQSHFKSISLDQAEFKETQESLMVIDQLAKGGDENNRVSKGQNLYNVYQTRSYTCTVEAMGNMMIQPMQYFQLENVPMFHGAYLITEVKHNIKPHYVTTTFKGTRVPRVTIPLVTDSFSTMNLGSTDVKLVSQGSIKDVLAKNDVSASFDDESFLDANQIFGSYEPVKDTTDTPCPTNLTDLGEAEGWVKDVNGKNGISKTKIRLCEVPGVSKGLNSEIAGNVDKLIKAAAADGIILTGYGWRSMATQLDLGRHCKGWPNWTSSSQCKPGVEVGPPGRSNHQSGNAVDFQWEGKTICRNYNPRTTVGCTKNHPENLANTWLIANAGTYGLINLPSEAWHYSINGS